MTGLIIYRDGKKVDPSGSAQPADAGKIARAEEIRRRFEEMVSAERPFVETLRLADKLGKERAAQRRAIDELKEKIKAY